PDFEQLYWLASEANDVLARVREDVKKELTEVLQRNRLGRKGDRPDTEDARKAEGLRLFFELKDAAIIPELMLSDFRREKSRGPCHDVWDGGSEIKPEHAKLGLWLFIAVAGAAALALGVLTLAMAVQGKPVAGVANYLMICGVLLAAAVPMLVLSYQWETPL